MRYFEIAKPSARHISPTLTQRKLLQENRSRA